MTRWTKTSVDVDGACGTEAVAGANEVALVCLEQALQLISDSWAL